MKKSKKVKNNLRGQQNIAHQNESIYRILLPPVAQARRERLF